MSGHRMGRTNEDVRRELTAILRNVKDPRVASAMLSVVRVEVTNDLSYATVYVSAMEGKDAAFTAVEGLKSAHGYVRRELGSALKLRHVPELRFIADDSIEYGAELTKKLRGINSATE